jgi:DNA-binding beta-propeller fold protein YncE
MLTQQNMETLKMMKTFVVIAVAALSACATPPGAAPVLGSRPAYLQATTENVPNAAALSNRIWTPALDDSYVPQGLTNAGRYLFVSSYKPTPDLKANTGPCRVFRIEAATGKMAGGFDIPAGTCTHSGGLAYVGNGKLFLADTQQVFLIDIEKALATGSSANASRAVKITGELRGSYATFDGKDAWIGTWTKEQSKARMFRLDPHLFDDYDGQTVKEDRAVESIPVPLEVQGAAFDKAGNLWVSASNSRWGKLYKLDRQGNVKGEYAMPAGLEDLTVDDSGRLWGLSESGTRKYIGWETKFPYIFSIDTAKLVP